MKTMTPHHPSSPLILPSHGRHSCACMGRVQKLARASFNKWPIRSIIRCKLVVTRPANRAFCPNASPPMSNVQGPTCARVGFSNSTYAATRPKFNYDEDDDDDDDDNEEMWDILCDTLYQCEHILSVVTRVLWDKTSWCLK